MKRVCFLAALLALGWVLPGRAQDAATEERLRQLSGKIEDLIAGQEAQRKRLEDLARAIENLRDQQNKPTPNYASQDDLQRLKSAIEDVDRKRMDDYEKIRAELKDLGRALAVPPPEPKRRAVEPTREPSGETPAREEKGITYPVKPGDTLSAIIASCRDQKINVTVRQILQANPGLKPDRIRPGMKIFIPVNQP